ncbi:MAG: host attachment protein [Alphaproteobacteria bacterium]|nr:host attachment protein [Alphaproteobacteria bacterium]MCB9928983.1 host attachment protein [Alphaproteobacteria bacterium]
MTLNIPHNAWILVGDGERALILRNDGDEKFPNLVTQEAIRHENPATREQGTDRPGRFPDGPSVQRSAVENTDWHRVEKDRFAREMAAHLRQSALDNAFTHLIVVAPPQVLGELRQQMDKAVQAKVLAEVDKDLTKHPVHEIERILVQKSG